MLDYTGKADTPGEYLPGDQPRERSPEEATGRTEPGRTAPGSRTATGRRSSGDRAQRRAGNGSRLRARDLLTGGKLYNIMLYYEIQASSGRAPETGTTPPVFSPGRKFFWRADTSTPSHILPVHAHPTAVHTTNADRSARQPRDSHGLYGMLG